MFYYLCLGLDCTFPILESVFHFLGSKTIKEKAEGRFRDFMYRMRFLAADLAPPSRLFPGRTFTDPRGKMHVVYFPNPTEEQEVRYTGLYFAIWLGERKIFAATHSDTDWKFRVRENYMPKEWRRKTQCNYRSLKRYINLLLDNEYILRRDVSPGRK